MKPLLRFSVSLLVLGALLKICRAQCSVSECSNPNPGNLSVTTRTVTLVPGSDCSLSTGNITSKDSINNLTPGAVYPIFFACFNCCKAVTTKPEAVGSLAVANVTTSSVFLNWAEPNGTRSFYKVQVTNESLIAPARDTSINITGLTAGVRYQISVTAVADDNQTEGEKSTVSTYTKPEAVRNLTVTEITTSSISLNWTEPGGNRSFYRVQWTNGTANWDKNVTDTNITVTGLTAGVQYRFTVIAVAGENTTQSDMAQTSHYTRPNTIEVPTVSTTTSSISLTWRKPPGEVFKYKVEWNNGGSQMVKYTNDTSADLSSLIPGTIYTITVTAVAGDNQTKGDGRTLTSVTKPEAVRNLTVTEITTSSISLNWTEPGGNRSFYRVQWTNGTANWDKNVTDTNITVTGLTAGVQYRFTVIAVAGENTTQSDMAQTSHYTRPNTIEVPTVSTTTSSISLTWRKPPGEVFKYKVEWNNGGSQMVKYTNDTSADLSSLIPGTIYTITVTAVAGDNQTKGDGRTLTSVTKPQAVRNLSITDITTSSISLMWTEPEGNRSFYRVKWTDGKVSGAKNVTQTQINITNLTAGVQYNITVTAVADDERTEGQSEAVTRYTRPEVVTNLTVAKFTTSSISLMWTEPGGNRSFYRVQWTNGTANWDKDVTDTNITVTGLTAGVQFRFTVIAVAGENTTQSEMAQISHYTKPEAVRNLTVTEITTSSISLNWTEPGGNRSFYRVQWTNETANWDRNVTDTNITVTGLTAGVQYRFTVIAVAGENTTQSDMAQTSHYTRPEVVTNLTVAKFTTSSISLMWTEPEGNRSFYRVQWTIGTANWDKNVTDTNITVTGLTAGVQYRFTVIAVAGENTIQSEMAQTSHYTKPEAVRILTVTEITTSSISLNWTEPGGNRSFYRVQWTNETANWDKNVTDTNITVTGLTAGVQYRFTVIAVAGENTTQSDMAQTSHYTRPNTIEVPTVSTTTSSISLTWRKPPGEVFKYKVEWNNGGSQMVKYTNDTSADLSSLIPGTIYTITVTAVAGDNQTKGDGRTLTSVTKPEAVRNLSITDITTSSISLMWTEPEGNRSFYRVKWTDGKVSGAKNVTQTQINITNLTAGVQYNITVTAVADDECTEGQSEAVTRYSRPEVVTNLTVAKFTTSSISLMWIKPEGNSSFYRVSWTDGKVSGAKNVTPTQTTITNLTAGVQYNITVTAVADDERTEGQSEAVTQYTRPEVVTNLTVAKFTTSSISLMWIKPEGNSSFYRVSWTDGKVSGTKNVTPTQTTITNLTAGVQYNITVTAVADDERTEGQSEAVTQYTRPEVVTNLTVAKFTTSSISLMWIKPEGNSSFYRVSWTDGKVSGTKNVTPTQTTITNLTAGVQYNITVTAVADDERTEGQSEAVTHYTRPEVVTNLTVAKFTTSSISLMWIKPEGNSSFYRVSWTDGKVSGTKNVTPTQTTITNLTAGVQYNITVNAVADDERTEGQSEAVTHYTRPEVVTNLTVAKFTTSSISLMWIKPEGNSSFYRVSWTDGKVSGTKNVTPTQTTITNLTAGVQYNITVTAVADDERTEGQSEAVTQYTRPEVVTNLTVAKFTTSSISLMWIKPEGNSSFYRVSWTDGKVSGTKNVTPTQTTITNLTAGVQYNITVTAVADDERTEGQSEAVTQYTRPEVVTNLTVAKFTTSSISLMWIKPEGNSSFYRVSWTDGKVSGTKNVTPTQTTITNLTAGVQYNITVTAVADDERTEGQSEAVTQYTRPEVVTNLTVAKFTTSSISLMWIKPEGNSSFYRVSWTDGKVSGTKNVTPTQTTITNLTAGVQYNITVNAVADDERTEGQSEAVTHYTRPEVVTNLTVAKFTTSSISLMWIKPEGNSSFYRVSWTDGKVSGTKNVTPTQTTITNLTAGVQYNITVTAVADDERTEGQSEAVTHYTRPEVVTNLNVTEITTSSISLMWIKPEGNSSFYRVSWTDGKVSGAKNVTPTQTTITNLTAGVQYNITVTAVADDKRTEGQSNFITRYTRPNRIEVLTVSRTTTSISLSWRKPPGDVFKYKVEWNNGGSQMVNFIQNNSTLLSDLIPGTRYTITITAVAGDNTTGEPQIFTEVTKPALVGNFSITDVTTSSVSLHWDVPVGNATSYRVRWTLGEDTSNSSTSDTSFIINNLIPGSWYNITVSAVAIDPTNEGETISKTTFTVPVMPEDISITARGTNTLTFRWTLPKGGFERYVVNISNRDLNFVNSSTTTNNTTNFAGLLPGRLFFVTVTAVAGNFRNTSAQFPAATVPTPPRFFTISHPTNSSLRLQWQTPYMMDGAPDIIYNITYQPTSGSAQNTNSTSNNTELTMLSSGTSYNVTVSTIGPQNQMSSIVHNSSYTLPNPVLNLVASPESINSIKVQWSDPQGVQQYYTYMVVAYNATEQYKTTFNNYTVGNLEPGTRYDINVTTIAAPGIKSTVEQTFSYTMPKAVTNLKVVDVNTTAIQLKWSRQNDHKPSYSYRVEALHNNIVVQNASTETETYTFSNLTPGEYYTFKVITVVERVESTVATAQSFTQPAAVSDITASGTTTTLRVSWTRAVGHVDFYTVNLYRDSQLVQNRSNLSNNVLNTPFENLAPGVIYLAEVVTHSGNFENKNTVYNATFPNPPGTITVKSQTVSSITFTWPLPLDMNHRQYNFSVSHVQGSYLTENNSFLLNNLQSGSPYNLTVVTVGVIGYESTAVMTKNYTRPYPVTRLTQSGITTDAVTLVWMQPQSKPDYTYIVQFYNGTFVRSLTVPNTTTTVSQLLSGSNYSFTVITLAADGTPSDPRTVSYFTRPFSVTGLTAVTLNTTAVRLSWNKPPQYKPDYTYQVNTTGCGSKNENQSREGADISALTPGTNCTFCVFVRAADGTEGEASCISQYTKPETVQPSVSSQGANSSIQVSWTKPPGRVELYKVRLNSTFSKEQDLSSSNTSFLFENLPAGQLYSVTVFTVSGPFSESSGFVTNATFPNPPGPITVLMKTTSSIEFGWQEAPLMTGARYLYRCIIPSQSGVDIPSKRTSHNFTSLLSGTPYNISVFTVGPMGFESDKVQIHEVTTRPFAVMKLSTSTEENSIMVIWDKPDQYKDSYRFNVTWQKSDVHSVVVKETQYKIPDLVPGSSYNIRVTTETSDGTEGEPTLVSSCTNASPVTNLRCEAPNTRFAQIKLSWNKPKGESSGFQVTVDNRIINATSSCCEQTVSNLSHYTNYTLTVKTLSCGLPSTPTKETCRTGITNPPIPPGSDNLVVVKERLHNKFTIQIEPQLLANTSGPITHVGVLVTEKIPDNTSDLTKYLSSTYDQWKKGSTPVYLATVRSIPLTRSQATHLSIEIGDESKYLDYTNGALTANREYKFATVLFTDLKTDNSLIIISRSLASVTPFLGVVLPSDPAVTAIAIGATLGIFFVLFIILIGFIIYWRRLSDKESSDIQIHAMRAKVSVAVRVEDYEAYYRKQKADSNCGFAEEFEDLKLVGTGQSKTNALTLENKPKNRYNNVLPYDSSRVKLSIIHGNPYDDYVNANYMPGYNSRKEFIAAQGPLPTTVNEFWRMIWEKNVQTLVMLTRCNEQGRVKCEQYWETGTKIYEDINVTTTSEIPLEDWTIRDFDIKNVKTAETRAVRHFHFTAWPDHGVPETTELLISFRHLVREHMNQYSRHSPTVVHCSAGVGRTGTFIAIDRLLFQIERENIVDVYGIVHDLRMHRPLMVQTEDQYVFLNQCAMDIIRSRTGTNVDLIYQNTAALSIYENVQPKKGYGKNGFNKA
ncbi:receptor-type tyrosine-protein phosphatase beta-like isoform X4 [Acanthopagrus latus]|uniref:receptor-type tyrosine-protein phosphatase beta-like isoform X4 n=1 Tax=Acanthopagrus latus TaxID=8177 RepID=UPI00187CA352|nr:receptor-type tyrosine-protein phosphatase beta-like isoform X4 [Acanthopagrus latus]